MIAPGSTVGLMGGGQLGRMFAIAARRMGYFVHTLEPTPLCPAGQVSDVEINAAYDDPEALKRLVSGVQVVTFEFENIPHTALTRLAEQTQVRPGPHVLLTCQNRQREKEFLRQHGFPTAPFVVVRSAGELGEALRKLGLPAVLKTADFGYDGKGQIKLSPDSDPEPEALWARFASPVGVVEGWIDFVAELSVVVGRGASGEMAAFPVSENIHTHHILDLSIVPARLGPEVQAAAQDLARAIAEALEVVGLLAVEMFLCRDGTLLVNELAPRPHNSGHYTFDACVTSQFEQQLRAVCGMPLGETRLLSPVVMVNLLGDLWAQGEPDWRMVLEEPSAKLHLYGKSVAKPGRKMGHICVLDPDPSQALEKALTIKARLSQRAG
ncbi:MAG: 5-(carboxyamino)imidazole ribonucleotide synthase [Candidatus Methylacidiphilales bacterium]